MFAMNLDHALSGWVNASSVRRELTFREKL